MKDGGRGPGKRIKEGQNERIGRKERNVHEGWKGMTDKGQRGRKRKETSTSCRT